MAQPIFYRDSEGRLTSSAGISVEHLGLAQKASEALFIEIRDPVAGYRYVLDPVLKIAHRASYHAEAVIAMHRARCLLRSDNVSTTPLGTRPFRKSGSRVQRRYQAFRLWGTELSGARPRLPRAAKALRSHIPRRGSIRKPALL